MIVALFACGPPTPADTDTVPVSPPLPWTDLSATVESIRADNRVPALAAASIGPGGIEAFGIAGRRSTGADDLVTWDDAFHLGSLTKSMTGTLAGRLVERGLVDFSTPIETVWPNADAGWHGTTLEDLLKHQSGAPANGSTSQVAELYVRGDATREARAWFADQLFASPPPAPRGAYLYSNAGIMLAGAMLEALDDRSWEDALRAEVFEPLGMDRCGFGPPLDGPWGHAGNNPLDPTLASSDNPAALGPAGTVHCPMEDYSHYVVAHLTDDPSFLDQATWDVLHAPASGDYAAGWIVLSQPWTQGDALFHDGSNTFWYAWAWIAPGADRAYVAFTNRGDTNAEEALQAVTVSMLEHDR